MSCHDIGRGLNSVVKVTVELFDAGKISKEAAMRIIHQCANGVNWCDGNTSEAIDYIRRCRCGRCFKMVPEGEKLYSIWAVSNNVPNRYKIFNAFDLASDGLCEECFDIVLNEHTGVEDAGARERAYIEGDLQEAEYTSTGEYEDTNNMCRWV